MRLCVFAIFIWAVWAGCPFKGRSAAGEAECPHRKLADTAAPDVTQLGCNCTSECQASVDDAYTCDWCYTTGCGISQVLSSQKYDYCKFPADTLYEAQSWKEKLSHLWSEIVADTTMGAYPSVIGVIKESIQTTFINHKDTMPNGRQKMIHSVGTVCKFKMDIAADSPFSGVFAAGTTAHGLLRMGTGPAADETTGIVPGVAVKFLRSGKESGNFVALNSLDALPDNNYNFFALPLSNHLPAAKGFTKVLGLKFNQGSNCISQVGLSDICRYGTDGSSPTTGLNFPFQLKLTSPNIQLPTSAINLAGLHKRLVDAITDGSELYTVEYWSEPAEYKNNTAPTFLGKMVIDGQCTTSKFGDSSLFFRHQLVEDDWALRPAWHAQMDPLSDCSTVTSLPVAIHPPKSCIAAPCCESDGNICLRECKCLKTDSSGCSDYEKPTIPCCQYVVGSTTSCARSCKCLVPSLYGCLIYETRVPTAQPTTVPPTAAPVTLTPTAATEAPTVATETPTAAPEIPTAAPATPTTPPTRPTKAPTTAPKTPTTASVNPISGSSSYAPVSLLLVVFIAALSN